MNKKDMNNPTHSKKNANDFFKRVAKTEKKPSRSLPLIVGDELTSFRALVVAWNHICGNKTVYDTDKDAICQAVCSVGEEKGWLEWDDNVMEYYFIPEGCHLSEVR